MATSPFATYAGLRVLVTGHTGFKGAWLSLWLAELGAEVIGISDRVPTDPSFYVSAGVGDRIEDCRGDIRDAAAVAAVVCKARPDLIFHLAAQPIVRAALANPYDTVAVNVLGTVAILEAARQVREVRAVVVVTSDKVYRDRPIPTGYSEDHAMGGREPYGASKAAAELIAEVYRYGSFHRGAGSANVPAIATARAGNVIGGGDWAPDRIVPDIVRAICAERELVLRYPWAVRPWQHVLEPLSGYLVLGDALLRSGNAAPACVNFGPADPVPLTVQELVEHFMAAWGPSRTGVLTDRDTCSVETAILRVDSGLAERKLGWHATWSAPYAIAETARWYKAWAARDSDMGELSKRQIARYSEDAAARKAAMSDTIPMPSTAEPQVS